MTLTGCGKVSFLIGDDAPAKDVVLTDSPTALVARDIQCGIGVLDPHVIIVRSVAGIARVKFNSPRQTGDAERRPLSAAVDFKLLGPSIASNFNVIKRHDDTEVTT